MADSDNMELAELREEVRQLYGRLADIERQLSHVLMWLNRTPNPSMPHRRYPARLEKDG